MLRGFITWKIFERLKSTLCELFLGVSVTWMFLEDTWASGKNVTELVFKKTPNNYFRGLFCNVNWYAQGTTILPPMPQQLTEVSLMLCISRRHKELCRTASYPAMVWTSLSLRKGGFYCAGLWVLRKLGEAGWKQWVEFAVFLVHRVQQSKTNRTKERHSRQKLCPFFMVMVFPINGKILDNRET